jgi:hypothetical protein
VSLLWVTANASAVEHSPRSAAIPQYACAMAMASLAIVFCFFGGNTSMRFFALLVVCSAAAAAAFSPLAPLRASRLVRQSPARAQRAPTMINAGNLRSSADERSARLLAAKAASGKTWDEVSCMRASRCTRRR